MRDATPAEPRPETSEVRMSFDMIYRPEPA